MSSNILLWLYRCMKMFTFFFFFFFFCYSCSTYKKQRIKHKNKSEQFCLISCQTVNKKVMCLSIHYMWRSGLICGKRRKRDIYLLAKDILSFCAEVACNYLCKVTGDQWGICTFHYTGNNTISNEQNKTTTNVTFSNRNPNRSKTSHSPSFFWPKSCPSDAGYLW